MGDIEAVHGMSSPDDCVDECNAYTGTPSCNAMTYIGSTNSCYLKNVPADAVPVEKPPARGAVAWRMCESA